MIQIHQLAFVISAVIGVALLSSCGQGPLSDATKGMNTPSPGATATSGLVTIHVDAIAYRLSDTLSVTISNQDTQTIYFLDYETNCTVIQVEKYINGNWEFVAPCGRGGSSSWQTLDAKQQLTVKIPPPELAPPLDGHWTPGIYRAKLRYRTAHQFKVLITIFSESFQIH